MNALCVCDGCNRLTELPKVCTKCHRVATCGVTCGKITGLWHEHVCGLQSFCDTTAVIRAPSTMDSQVPSPYFKPCCDLVAVSSITAETLAKCDRTLLSPENRKFLGGVGCTPMEYLSALAPGLISKIMMPVELTCKESVAINSGMLCHPTDVERRKEIMEITTGWPTRGYKNTSINIDTALRVGQDEATYANHLTPTVIVGQLPQGSDKVLATWLTRVLFNNSITVIIDTDEASTREVDIPDLRPDCCPGFTFKTTHFHDRPGRSIVTITNTSTSERRTVQVLIPRCMQLNTVAYALGVLPVTANVLVLGDTGFGDAAVYAAAIVADRALVHPALALMAASNPSGQIVESICYNPIALATVLNQRCWGLLASPIVYKEALSAIYTRMRECFFAIAPDEF